MHVRGRLALLHACLDWGFGAVKGVVALSEWMGGGRWGGGHRLRQGISAGTVLSSGLCKVQHRRLLLTGTRLRQCLFGCNTLLHQMSHLQLRPLYKRGERVTNPIGNVERR